jgi:hypothetical protein
MIQSIYQFGDQIKLKKKIDVKKLKKELEPFENFWEQYNPNKSWIAREGLCVLNEKGKVGTGPALDSIFIYNQKHGTNWTEYDFNLPTEVYKSSEQISTLMGEILPHCCRTHFLKLKPGGYFPPHRDHVRGEQNVFRLIVPIQTCNPPQMRFMIEDRTLHWDVGNVYAINTTKEHSLFNMSNSDSIWLVINTILHEETIEYVQGNLEVS